MDNLIAKVYQSPKTVLTTEDFALLWEETNPINLKAKISYYVKRGDLIRLQRGVFAKDKNYNSRELATSLYAPSYVSFETVLRDAGVIFQHYDTIFAAGPWSKTVTIDNQTFTFRRLKDALLFNPAGTIFQDNYTIATIERAFLDMVYLFPDYYFDNLTSVNWEKCFELAVIYANQEMMKRVNKYKSTYAS